VHHLLVRNVAVGEDDFIDVVRAAQCLELRLFDDRDAFGIEPARKRRRIAPIVDPGDLGGGEGDDFDRRVATIDGIKLWKSLPAAPRMTTRRRRSPLGSGDFDGAATGFERGESMNSIEAQFN